MAGAVSEGAISEGRQTLESLATAAGLLSDEEANSESPEEAQHQAAGSTAAQGGAQHAVAEGARGPTARAAKGKATPMEQAARPKRGRTDTSSSLHAYLYKAKGVPA